MPQKTAAELLKRAEDLLKVLRTLPPREQSQMSAEGITEEYLVSLISKLTAFATLRTE